MKYTIGGLTFVGIVLLALWFFTQPTNQIPQNQGQQLQNQPQSQPTSDQFNFKIN